MTNYSHSKLGTFLQCKQKYKFQYIDKITTDIKTVEAFMGSMVHEALEKLYKDLQFQKLNSKREILDFYLAKWKENWTEDVQIAKKEYTQKNYQDMGKKFLSEYYDHYKPFNHLTTIGLETQDFFPLENGNQYHVRIDRLACDKEGNYYICDYKTNSQLKAQEELDEDRQLAMYSLWVHRKYPDAKSVKLVWYFLAFDKEMISERNEKQLTFLKRGVEELIAEIEGCTEFPTEVSALCNYCGYKQICPAWKHELELEKKTSQQFKEDDGVKLVDKFSSLKATIQGLEDELEDIKEQLISFSSQKNVSIVYGSERKISVRHTETLSFPSKTERGELNELIKENGLWDELSDLDTYKLAKLVKSNDLPKALSKKIQQFITKTEGFRLSLSKKK